MAGQGKKRETAAKIFDAAESLFCELGYDGVSARDIAERAGANKALVFYYYGSKAQLFEQILARYYDSQIKALTAAFQKEGNLKERLHSMIDGYLDFIGENHRYLQLVQQLVANSPAHHELVRQNLTPLFDWMVDTLAGVAPEDGPLAPRQFYVTFAGIVINYFTYAPVNGGLWNRDPLSAEALAERREHIHWMVDTVVAGLAAE